MKIGVPKEIKNHEYRIAIVPSGVRRWYRQAMRFMSKTMPRNKLGWTIMPTFVLAR